MYKTLKTAVLFLLSVSLMPLMAEAIEVEEIVTIAKRTESQPSQLSASTAIVTVKNSG